ncbi:epoxide hydrolase family protein [Kineosporia succinea]|uniref:Pimeloyl-ACP methyl ester carboxylesterase n=1 Tax=Kineosporia succinea TaxID=84632 RepID=A0ABT9PC24_9ACTN|nr:epoxide hydrolase family protein [Kineosporia succinea]MDP9829725.1 pimeloyl-ACP methyl ester carboxylesterase [Kineosporia succinea]
MSNTSSPLLQVAPEELDDLTARLRRTRFARPWPLEPWRAGTGGDDLRRLVTYWADGYDWRAHERRINALPHHFADLDGTPVHYLRYDAEREGALPIVATNGWPSSFLEMTELAQRLSNPSRYGGRPEDAFTVIVPSIPGYGFSPQRPTLDGTPTHELWHRLMRDELGFTRYGAHGSDLGAGITGRMGHAEPLVGIHLTAIDNAPRPFETELTDAERTYQRAWAKWVADEGAYEHQQGTRPLTLAQGLGDSPAGLLAWILEKYRAWSDCGGDVSTRFSDDFLLTQASLYWFTDTISTSFRPYYERARAGSVQHVKVEVPTAVAVFPADLGAPPLRSWAERIYHLTRFTEMPRGGHFAAHEEPELLANDITAFFRELG